MSMKQLINMQTSFDADESEEKSLTHSEIHLKSKTDKSRKGSRQEQ